jgi:hypothetical protein
VSDDTRTRSFSPSITALLPLAQVPENIKSFKPYETALLGLAAHPSPISKVLANTLGYLAGHGM